MKKLLIYILFLCLPVSSLAQQPMLGQQINWANPLSRGLIGYWLFNGGSGNQVFDLSGNGRTGTVTGSARYLPGKFGPCMQFIGTLSGLQLPEVLVPDRFTVSLWFNLDYVHYRETFFGDNNNAVDYVRPKDATSIDIMTDNTKNFIVSTILAEKWYHLVVTRDSGANFRVYLNGVQSSTGPQNLAHPLQINGFSLGTDSDYAYNSLYDNIGMWNRALSDSEVAQLYREPFALFEIMPLWMFYQAPADGEGCLFNVFNSILNRGIVK